jgi:hypothetical protein
MRKPLLLLCSDATAVSIDDVAPTDQTGDLEDCSRMVSCQKSTIALTGVAMMLSGGAFSAERPAGSPVAALHRKMDDQEFAMRAELEYSLSRWIAATNARDFASQAAFYPEKMEAFYLWREVPRTAVLAEKRRVFEHARQVKVTVEEPVIVIETDRQEARMYFRKLYLISGPDRSRAGEVLQELRWMRERGSWKIASERDIRVLR